MSSMTHIKYHTYITSHMYGIILRISYTYNITHVEYHIHRILYMYSTIHIQYIMCSTINRLYVSYHNLLKMFLGLPKYESTRLICMGLDVQCCQAVIRKLIYKFMSRLEASKNGIIVAVLESSIYYVSRIRKHLLNLLHISSG